MLSEEGRKQNKKIKQLEEKMHGQVYSWESDLEPGLPWRYLHCNNKFPGTASIIDETVKVLPMLNQDF